MRQVNVGAAIIDRRLGNGSHTWPTPGPHAAKGLAHCHACSPPPHTLHTFSHTSQDPAIAKAAGRFTMLLAPALIMDGVDQCCRRYLLAQSVSQPQMYITFAATLLTPMFLWFFILR